MDFAPHFWTTHLGSVPHVESSQVCRRLAADLDLPGWPQLPRRTFRENMYVQFSATLPAILVDEVKERVFFDTRGDLSEALEAFYTRYLANDLAAFALSVEYAQGFPEMLETLKGSPGVWAKGQVTGPISFGLTVTDQDLRASLYNDFLADAIVKNMAMNALWQIGEINHIKSQVVIFVDEPYLASFGSAFISLSREQATSMLEEVVAAIHSAGALAGVHCCGNTDWGLLLDTSLDILSLDAYTYIENLALYPRELRAFLDRKGAIAWGIVPNNELVYNHTPQDLANRLRGGLTMLSQRAVARGINLPIEQLASHSLVSPSCGLGTTTVDIADRVVEVLIETGDILKREL